MKYILCSDLHLSEKEKDYSFSVLREILSLCKEKECEVLLLAGDIFDSWNDMERLHSDFCDALKNVPDSCAVYFLPGNHEELRAKGNLENYNFGKAKLLAEKPWNILTLSDDAELLAIPFQRNCSEYRNWAKIPAKEKPLRIVLAHGTVPGIVYTGPSGEDEDSFLDEDIFAYLQADIAALGHIHKQILARKGNTLIAYPGSARVWRDGEYGKRCVIFGNTKAAHLEPIPIRSAGEYRIIPVQATPEGELRYNPLNDISRNDWLHLEVAGVVEDESFVIAALENLKTKLKDICRKISDKRELSVLSGISAHQLATAFLRVWEEKQNLYAEKESPGVYELARLQGLLALKNILEKRK
jgi:DNA repair exonuclease SbcCD nuclease subunit